MRKIGLLSVIAAISVAAIVGSCSERAITADVEYNSEGPAAGSLIIAGGSLRDTSVVNRFISLAGGEDALILFVPTSSGRASFDTARTVSLLTSAGARNVELLHTYDPEVADSEEFASVIREAGGIFFGGGRQWRLVDAYGGTLAEREFRALLDRGGVIGGSSAGATIQGSYLVRGDTATNTIMMGSHTRGFGYITNSAIDQHLLVRNRQNDLLEVIEEYPSLLGIGIDENTAVLVQGNELEVLGESFVAIYDHSLWSGSRSDSLTLRNDGRFFLLRRGDRYNIKEREVIRLVGGGSRNPFTTTGD